MIAQLKPVINAINRTIHLSENRSLWVCIIQTSKFSKCTSSRRFCDEQARWSESGARGVHVYGKYINYLCDYCQLLTFTNSLDPDQAQQKVSRDQYRNRLTPWVRGLKSLSLYWGKQCRS